MSSPGPIGTLCLTMGGERRPEGLAPPHRCIQGGAPTRDNWCSGCQVGWRPRMSLLSPWATMASCVAVPRLLGACEVGAVLSCLVAPTQVCVTVGGWGGGIESEIIVPNRTILASLWPPLLKA